MHILILHYQEDCIVLREPACERCTDANVRCTGVLEASCDRCARQKRSCNTTNRKIPRGRKRAKTAEAETSEAGPSRPTKRKAVVVVPPAPTAREAPRQRRRHWRPIDPEFAALALQLSEGYQTIWRSVAVATRAFATLSDGYSEVTRVMGEFAAYAKGESSESETD